MFYTSYTNETAITVIQESAHVKLDIKELIVTHVILVIMCHHFKMEKMFVQVRYIQGDPKQTVIFEMNTTLLWVNLGQTKIKLNTSMEQRQYLKSCSRIRIF